MKLRITYRPSGSTPVNVQIIADATATAGDVARALAKGPNADVAVPEDARLTLHVTDGAGRLTPLPVTQEVISSGLVSTTPSVGSNPTRRSESRSP